MIYLAWSDGISCLVVAEGEGVRALCAVLVARGAMGMCVGGGVLIWFDLI